ncbi:hypothetical protein LOTGIDRAFT_122343, partial [Lottia gigantea]
LTPSRFMFEMSMNTEQKLANTHVMKIPRKTELLDMGDTSLQKFSQINIDEPMFQPYPSEIYFQNYDPHQVYEVPLTLRNNDKVPRLVKVSCENSPYFKIISPHDVGNKVGPGLPTIFKIQFTPHEKKDYRHELICTTEREKFVVPVNAIGARAILDFPDKIHFPVSPVKYTNTRTLLIRNIGNLEAKFNIHAEGVFSVTPDIGVLGVNESMQVVVEFTPNKIGDHNSELILHLDTGEDIYIVLYGAAQDSNVRLDKNSIKIENTYISMANQRTITINNRSSVIAHFKWTQFATQEEEDQEKLLQQIDLERAERRDKDRFLDDCILDPTLRDKLSILERSFLNRKRIVAGDNMMFDDDVVKIEPVEGEIWPHSSYEVNVVFKPNEAKSYTRTAYCDITGRESRLPLRIKGDGMGPQLEFSIETLDMGNIFIGSVHSYEIVLANHGDIDAIYSVLPNASLFGPCFQFDPSEGIVMPSGHQAIRVTFCSQHLGDFSEEFCFQIDGSPEQLKVKFSGSVIGPTFQFNVPKLKFGTVSYGFLHQVTCNMLNTALVPLTYHLRVPGDGSVESISSTIDSDATDSNRSEFGSLTSEPPKEFHIIPADGTIPPQSEIKITINLISNTIKKYDMKMVVDVEGVGNEILSLPISAKCVVPQIAVLTPVLDYGRCFLRHPFEYLAKLHNDNDLPAKYEVLPQSEIGIDDASITYSSSIPRGIIAPRSVCSVPIIIAPQSLEEQDVTCYINIFGSTELPLPIHLTCIGEGPVVHVQPDIVDWGLIPVLTPTDRYVMLTNESLIPAKFEAYMMKPKSVFYVEPKEGVIPPESQFKVKISAYLDDCVKFQDKLQIHFEESRTQQITLMAYGQGTTIESDPPLSNFLDLGPNFSNRPLNMKFKLTNSGRRHQQLVWSTEGFGPISKARREMAAYNPLDMKFKDRPPPVEPARAIFRLTPSRMDLAPGECIQMNLEGFVSEPKPVEERLLCHAILGRQGGKELIMKVDIQADFISPLLDFSTKSVFFRVDKLPEDELKVQCKELIISNVSTLPLSTELTLQYPFSILADDGTSVLNTVGEVHLPVGEQYFLMIQFDPAYKDDQHIRTIDEVLHIAYKQHPHKDYIALRGEVYFPNIEFEKSNIDFGCILNDTEVTRYVNLTNNSPMEVKYRWSFLIENQPLIRHHPKRSQPLTIEEVDEVQEESQEEPQVEVVVQDDNEDLAEEEVRPKTEREKDETQEEVERLEIGSRMSRDVESALKSNRALSALLEQPDDLTPISVEEIFDILPLYGTLQPGDTEQITLTFYGHADIWGQVKALCEVEGGPNYELTLTGEASLVEYSFDTKDIDFGKLMYDNVGSAEITLINTGKVGFNFTGLNMDPSLAKHPKPGHPIMIPHTGYIEPLSEQKIVVKFLPGVPEKFHKSFQIQVAHFEPDTIHVYGEGVFSRISLDLPRNTVDGGYYESMMKEAKQRLNRGNVTEESGSSETVPSELELQLEVERLAVRDHAIESAVASTYRSIDTPPNTADSKLTDKKHRKTKVRTKLPEYLLDFGYVVLGTVKTHVVSATNTGWFPVSFQVERENLHSLGFHVELDRVKNLPGAPDHELVDFMVKFDPRGANLPLGPVETVVPINIINGPQVNIRLKANVTMPDMLISDDTINFDDVKCGECKVVTVQLHNYQNVRCEWSSLPSGKELKQANKKIPMHLRRKMKMERKKAQHFEMMPPCGSLMPGQRMDVQVKFMPTEEKFYEHRIPLRIVQSSQRILLFCRGQGLEPRIELERNLVQFGPILPHSSGDEQEVTIRNPCSFPIEVYNLEFDNTYLEEEKVLRLMKGYDEYNTLLLPPRDTNEKLPTELLQYYDDQMKRLEEEERQRLEAEEAENKSEQVTEDGTVDNDTAPGALESGPAIVTTVPSRDGTPRQPVPQPPPQDEHEEEASSNTSVGELEITPVSASIARHLGIDLTPEGKAARNRRGIAIIIHGAPMAGKTSAAVTLAKHYETAILTVDGVVSDAISNGNTQAGRQARELCAEAARKKAEEIRGSELEEAERKNAGAAPGALIGAAPSVISGRKTSTVTELKAKHASLAGTKTTAGAVNTSSVDGATGSQVREIVISTMAVVPSSSPPPLVGPIARRLSVSVSTGGEEGFMSCVLPEDLLTEILAERLQLNDCHRGVVFDGLDTLFSQNYQSTANAILKALNNRRFIFFLTLKLDYNVLKEQERKDLEEKECQAKIAEENERRRLEEMSEEEYDALSEEEKAVVDQKRLAVKKERLKKELEEKLEREKREREAREEEQRRLEEEAKNKKGKKGKPGDSKDKDKKGQPAGGRTGAAPSVDRVGQKSQLGPRPHDSDHIAVKTASNADRPESHQTEKSDTVLDEAKFKNFEHSQKDLNDLLENWDRTTLQIRRPPTPSEKSDEDGGQHPPSGKKGKGKDKHEKEKEKEREKERQKQLEKEAAEKAAREAAIAAGEIDVKEGETVETEINEPKPDDGIGIPHILLDCSTKDIQPGEKALELGKLPSLDEVLDGLGLGNHGPPIPPPASFSVIPYPVKRKPPPVAEFGGQFLFIASSPDDPNVGVEEKPKDLDLDEEKSVTPDKIKEELTTPTKSKGKTDKQKVSGESKKERKSSADRKKVNRRGSVQAVQSPPPGATTPVSDVDGQRCPEEKWHEKCVILTIFRWVVPANGETVLRLRFQSEELGQFDQTLNFEIVGTRRRYQLFCRGVCAFPTISREPRIVFPQRKKSKKSDEIVNKKYILMTEVFEFGPLLVGKSRDRYKEGKYPENMSTMTVLNTSPLEADVSFCYLNDSKGDTFLLEPPSMVLKPGESAPLTIWAYPKVPGRYDDSIVCCVRENPEPIIFKVSCDGFRPELELDKKQLHFDKVLLHRKDTKTIYLRNSTMLPVAWKLSGLENLGDDFSVAADSGVVEPMSEYPLHAYFRALKPVQTSKKMIRLEISDKENIMGVVTTEAIQVIAEAYDVALDMSFPKGTDGGIDFGVIRVSEETKQVCTLKNKGKYEIQFQFVFENVDPNNPDISNLFSVIPSRGPLSSLDRPTQVQVIFKSQREVTIKDVPILKCHVIEPNLSDDGEIIATIPVKVSVKSVFSKFNILPMNDINFGSLLVNSKKTRTFSIENKGEFDFKYTIQRMVKDAPTLNSHTRQNRPHEVKPALCKSKSYSFPFYVTFLVFFYRQDATTGQSRLQLGMFTIFPAFGIILPNGHQTITVDCIAEQQGRSDEEISIDVTDRNPKSNPGGIPYKLLAEACIPSINAEDIGTIFEEHRICKNLSVWQSTNQAESGGVYGEEEKKFVFNNVIVGRKAKARFKISNHNKVPCDVVFSLKPMSGKGALKQVEVFEVEPSRTQVPNHSHMYVTITFTPPSMQSFSAIFDASIEGLSQNQARGKNLTFEVCGEGNLPRISIAKPTVRNKRGQPLSLFRKTLLSRTEALPIVLHNDGTLPSKVSYFKLLRIKIKMKRAHTASVVVNVGEKATFECVFKPGHAQRYQGHIRLSVIDNQYEDSIVQLVGEGYEDDVTLDNIQSVTSDKIEPEQEEGNMADDDVAGRLAVIGHEIILAQNLIFYLNRATVLQLKLKTVMFSMTNHNTSDCIRFQWPTHPELKFVPQIGHLHGGCKKDIAVTFKASEPKTFTEEVVNCKVSKISFDKPMEQVADWDDRIRTVKWVDNTTALERPGKMKVVEVENEPVFNEVPDTSRNLELLVSAVADYCQFKCKAEAINFKDTLMFQTRLYQVSMSNKGNVHLDFSWQVIMDSFIPSLPRAVTFMSEGERPESRVDVVDTSYIPFSIEPQYGSIAPKKKKSFTVKFSPLDVSDYKGRLVCSIPNLKDEEGPIISLSGQSLMPYCHFELMDSDYISGARRNPELRGPGGAPPGTTLDPNTRVIEFQCVGVGVMAARTTKKLVKIKQTLFLPLQILLQGIWSSESDKPDISAAFEFVSNQLGIVESFWRFVIPDQNISVPFLLVGNAREPDVSLDRSHLNFKALLIGREAIEKVNLYNNENVEFDFKFSEESCYSEGYSAKLGVQPNIGTIPPKSSIPIDLIFSPNSDKEVNFNLACKISRKILPVTLNVKAEGYSMMSSLFCEDSLGNNIELAEKGINQINFGEVEVNEEAIRNLFIINTGKFNFDFKWEILDKSDHRDLVKISPMKGGVMFGEKQKCAISFCPLSRMSLRGYQMELKISNGPCYTLEVIGQGVTPGLHFSYLSYNFGNCFIHRAGLPEHSTVLTLTNKDKKEISVDCLYEPTNHLNHTFDAGVIGPGKSLDITFKFYPRKAIKYTESVTFEINGLSKQTVEFTGVGSEMKIEVADPKMKIVNLGSKLVGEVVKKYIPIVNNSPAPITFNLALTPTSPGLQQSDILSIAPTSAITLPPRGGTCKVEVAFRPKKRIAPFTEEVMLECAGLFQPLFVVRGSCLGMEVSLDTEAIPFGAVIQKSQSTRKLVMSNTGDMNTKFRWDESKFKPDFSIRPVEGYITPGMEVTFDVTFHPQTLNQDIRYEKLKCSLDGSNKPIYLTLTGMCTGIPPVKETQHFATHVRQKETKHISIPNRTNQQWHLKPVIDGEYWSGPVTVIVEPQQNKSYELTYKPLTMTPEGKKHTGSIFFPLPDGTGLMYNLTGIAEPPKASGKITRDVPCKTSYTEILQVHNWLKKPQRFRVRVECLKVDKLDAGTTVKGIEYIDVPASSKKDYKQTFYAYKEGVSAVKVIFTNEQTGEYQFYEVTYRATRPGVTGTIELTSPVRQSVHHAITLENPLSYPVNFSLTCNVPEVLMPSQLNIQANSEGRLNLEYQPLRVGEVPGRIEFSCNDLGLYMYDLILKATPSGPEKALYFRTCLGQSQVQTAKFLNFAKQKTDYSCKIDNSDFHVDKTVAAAPGSTGGTEVAFDVSFEPSKLGEQKAVLTVSSQTGGEYIFPLNGSCIPPKPQGPCIIKAGSNTPITFRNVFNATTPFTFQVDNPLFHVSKQGESVRARKDHRIVVGFDGNDSNSKAAVMGKLIVSCASSAGGKTNAQWVYYLKGVTL